MGIYPRKISINGLNNYQAVNFTNKAPHLSSEEDMSTVLLDHIVMYNLEMPYIDESIGPHNLTISPFDVC